MITRALIRSWFGCCPLNPTFEPPRSGTVVTKLEFIVMVGGKKRSKEFISVYLLEEGNGGERDYIYMCVCDEVMRGDKIP